MFGVSKLPRSGLCCSSSGLCPGHRVSPSATVVTTIFDYDADTEISSGFRPPGVAFCSPPSFCAARTISAAHFLLPDIKHFCFVNLVGVGPFARSQLCWSRYFAWEAHRSLLELPRSSILLHWRVHNNHTLLWVSYKPHLSFTISAHRHIFSSLFDTEVSPFDRQNSFLQRSQAG